MTKMEHGLIIAKFNPLHMGHVSLIRYAESMVENLHVVITYNEDDIFPIDMRENWVWSIVRDADLETYTCPNNLPEENQPWADRVVEIFEEESLEEIQLDAVFSSEPWGDEYAEMLGAKHFCLDMERKNIPVSATAIREDLLNKFHLLSPPARSDIALKVVIIGAESTGKTTLSKDLSVSLDTVWVPEYGRYHSESIQHMTNFAWSHQDFIDIAYLQRQFERTISKQADHGVYICDTDVMVTEVWRDRYMGMNRSPGEIVSFLREQYNFTTPDLYILCAPTIAWEDDGTRNSADYREEMFVSIQQCAHLLVGDERIVMVDGNREERRIQAEEVIAKLTQELKV
jgi:HTH-type transcriptional repressor of NAD biosynthesis genes